MQKQVFSIASASAGVERYEAGGRAGGYGPKAMPARLVSL